MHGPPTTFAERRYALVQRVFLSRKSTQALYLACQMQPPWFIALTYLGRVKQFYRRAGIKWPWKV